MTDDCGKAKKGMRREQRLEGGRRDRDRALDALLSLVERLGPAPSPTEAAGAVISLLESEFGAKNAALYVVGAGGDLALLGSSGRGRAPRSIPRSSGFVRWLAEADGAVHVDAFLARAGASADEDEERLGELAEAGLATIVPVRIEETLVGALLHGAPEPGASAPRLDGEMERLLGRIVSIVVRAALRGDSARPPVRGSIRDRERNDLAGAISADVRAALSAARAAVTSLEPSAIDEQLLAGLAKGALVDLAGAVDRWTAVNELDADDGSIILVEVRGIVEDVLREMLAEFEERELRVAIEDGTGLREVPLDEKRFKIAVRGMLEAVVSESRRGGAIGIEIRISRGGFAARAGGAGPRSASEYLVVEVTGERDRDGHQRIVFDDGGLSEDLPPRAPRADRRSLGIAVARALISDLRGEFFETEGSRGRGYAARIAIDS